MLYYSILYCCIIVYYTIIIELHIIAQSLQALKAPLSWRDLLPVVAATVSGSGLSQKKPTFAP